MISGKYLTARLGGRGEFCNVAMKISKAITEKLDF